LAKVLSIIFAFAAGLTVGMKFLAVFSVIFFFHYNSVIILVCLCDVDSYFS
jgi:hypothetical protein